VIWLIFFGFITLYLNLIMQYQLEGLSAHQYYFYPFRCNQTDRDSIILYKLFITFVATSTIEYLNAGMILNYE